MKYTDICEDNKILFEALECLSNKINSCKASLTPELHANEIIYMQAQKERVRSTININLDTIEEMWSTELLRHKKRNFIRFGQEPNELEQAIIQTYLSDPNQAQYKIAKDLKVNYFQVSRVVGRYLRHEYTMAKTA